MTQCGYGVVKTRPKSKFRGKIILRRVEIALARVKNNLHSSSGIQRPGKVERAVVWPTQNLRILKWSIAQAAQNKEKYELLHHDISISGWWCYRQLIWLFVNEVMWIGCSSIKIVRVPDQNDDEPAFKRTGKNASEYGFERRQKGHSCIWKWLRPWCQNSWLRAESLQQSSWNLENGVELEIRRKIRNDL